MMLGLPQISQFRARVLGAALALAVCDANGVAQQPVGLPPVPPPPPPVPAEQVAARGTPGLQLAGELPLARLVDLCSERLKITLQYDASALTGNVSLRLGRPLSDQELWDLTLRSLALRGMTVVDFGADAGGLAVVRIAEAQNLAQVMVGPLDATRADYVSVAVEIVHRAPKDVALAIQPLLSRGAGAATPIAEARLLIVSDTRRRVSELLKVIAQVDIASEEPVIETIPVNNADATRLLAALTNILSARDAVGGQPLRGRILPGPDSGGLIVVAPKKELGAWRDLVAKLDRREEIVTRTYAPKHFAAGEVARLIEQSARESGPRGSGDRWKVVADQFTGTLTATATPGEHDRIAELIDRLNNVSVESRTAVKSFALKNRPVDQVLTVLGRLVEAGVLDRTPDEAETPLASQSVPGGPGGGKGAIASAPGSSSAGTSPPSTVLSPQGQALPRSGVEGLRLPGGAMQPSGGSGGAYSSSARRVSLTADQQTNSIIAVGESRFIEAIAPLIVSLDKRQPQVMIDVLLIALNESDALNLGVELERISLFGSTRVNLSSLFGLSQSTPDGGRRVQDPRGGTALVLDPGDFAVVVRALQTINKGRSLTSPKVLVNNNQEARLDSVLQQPFSTINASTTVATTAFGGTQDAGTQLTVRPQIAEGDHLGLNYTITLSNFVGQSNDPALPPPRQRNTLSSEVMIPDGHTIALGGFEVLSDTSAESQVPLLGDIPLIGEAFKNRSKTLSKQRFYVFITPTILREARFEDLKHISGRTGEVADIGDGLPVMQPKMMR